MMTTCPKCGYTRKLDDQAPNYECPKCGVVYSKVAKNLVIDQDRRDHPASLPVKVGRMFEAFPQEIISTKRHKRNLAVVFVAGLLIGYLAGREHVKYELRSAFQEAAAGLMNGVGSSFVNRGKPTPTKLLKKSIEQPVKAELSNKDFYVGEYGRSKILFSVRFANTLDKNIRAFDGVLHFTDLLDNEILSANLAINNPVAAGGMLNWDGEIEYNQFISRHENLRNQDAKNIKISFVPRKVLFEDGSVQEFNQQTSPNHFLGIPLGCPSALVGLMRL